jgi:hypothetical protein
MYLMSDERQLTRGDTSRRTADLVPGPLSERGDNQMKGLCIGLTLASVAFMAFSWVYGEKIDDLRASLWRRDNGGRSREEADRAYASFESRRSELHQVVTVASVVYYVGAAAILFVAFRSTRRKGWRIALVAGAVVALVMAAWSLLLSGAISFDEVFPAWLVASGVLGVLSLACLWAPAQPPVPRQVVRRA